MKNVFTFIGIMIAFITAFAQVSESERSIGMTADSKLERMAIFQFVATEIQSGDIVVFRISTDDSFVCITAKSVESAKKIQTKLGKVYRNVGQAFACR